MSLSTMAQVNDLACVNRGHERGRQYKPPVDEWKFGYTMVYNYAQCAKADYDHDLAAHPFIHVKVQVCILFHFFNYI